MQKKNLKKNQQEKILAPPPLYGLQKFSGSPFYSPRKIGINPTENHVDSIFRGEIKTNFFQDPHLFRPQKF